MINFTLRLKIFMWLSHSTATFKVFSNLQSFSDQFSKTLGIIGFPKMTLFYNMNKISHTPKIQMTF